MEMPVYLFTGFLDSGKTKFIQETLEDPRFYDGERTLVILCEEGEEEYNSSKYPSQNVFFHFINNIEDMNQKEFLAMHKKYRMNRVLIEYNGMWKLENLFSSLPENWFIYQIMTLADASTFSLYESNMRDLVIDKMKYSEMVVFNRVKKGEDLMKYHKIARSASRSIGIAYEYTDGEVEYDEFEDPLPFDINAPIIEIKDEDYAIWYRDLMEETDKYIDKIVKFKGIVAKDNKLPNNVFAIGRHIMTCCADDITFGGLVATYDKSNTLQTRDWVWIIGTISVEFNKIYGDKGPVIRAQSVEQTLPPKQELATFY